MKSKNFLGIVIAIVMAFIGLTSAATSGAYLAKVSNTNTARSLTYLNCSEYMKNAPKPLFAYGVTATGGTTETDQSGNGRTGTWNASPARSANGPCKRNLSQATLNGTQCLYNNVSYAAPNTFTIETWVNTTQTGAKIAGFSATTGVTTETNNDRMIYIGTDGKVYFAVYPNTIVTINSPTAINNGQWHYIVATLSSAGMRLYVDNVLVASNASVTNGENYTGYWKFGCGRLQNWPMTPNATNTYLQGTLTGMAIYNIALTPTQINEHWLATQW